MIGETGPEPGDVIRFVPAAYLEKTDGFGEILSRPVAGTVVQVNRDHRWYRVRYTNPFGEQFECFKF